jgi:regulator of nonsense transcripts 1
VLSDASYTVPGLTFQATPVQSEAVNRALSQPFTLIQGPPGTGKTRVIAAIVFHFFSIGSRPNEKVLVCGPSNAAVQNLAAALLLPMKGLNRKLVWLAAASRDIQPSPDLPPEFEALAYVQMFNDPSPMGTQFRDLQIELWKTGVHGKSADEQDTLRETLEKNLCHEADVICCTLETAARTCLEDLRFNIVIMDEATQAVEPSALIPLSYGAQRVVMVGDHRQLGPVVSGRQLERFGYDYDLFERMIDSQVPHILLNCQFRMHPEISAFPNKQFYARAIRDGITARDRLGPRLRCFPNPALPILFVHCAGEELEIGRSFANKMEVIATSNVVRTLLRGGVKSSQIGIITPYRPQVQLLEDAIRPDSSMHPGLKIATVDSFQGGECDYIIMSCVRTGLTIGFVKDRRRMNVSLTRARYGLVIIGNRDSLSRDSNEWAELCGHFADKKAIITVKYSTS